MNSKTTVGSTLNGSNLDVMPINLVTGDGVSSCILGPNMGSASAGSSSDPNLVSCTQSVWCAQPVQRILDDKKNGEQDDRIPHDLTNSHASVVDGNIVPVCTDVLHGELYNL